MLSNKTFNGERLKNARMYRGRTIAEIAEEVGVTKQAISQFENNKGNPSLETLLRISAILGFPRDYFYEEDKEKITIGNTYFRGLLTTNKKSRLSQIEKTKLVAKIYYFLDKYINFPQLNIPKLDVKVEDIEGMALELREQWGLGNEPIPNMVRLLEKNGFIVTSFSTDNEKIDAFSQRQKVEEKEYYFIVLGDDKLSATRRQFDAAHELGHVLLHDWSLDLEQISREEFRRMETEANQFAAAFLLPREAFLNDLILSHLSNIDYYIELKKKWKVSISAMIVRAYQLKAINYSQYQYLLRKMSKKGWRTKEPLDDVIHIPKPTLLKKAVELLIMNNVLEGDQILQELSKKHLSLDRKEVELLLGLEKDTLLNQKKNTPVLSIRENHV